jgi:hypothetical protein
MRAITWRYDQAESLNLIIGKKNDWYDVNVNQFFTDWQRDVFNLNTANKFGLVVWAVILDMPIFISQASNYNQVPFGFSATSNNFNNSNFDGSGGLVSNIPLEDIRTLLKLRYIKLITKGNSAEINRLISYVFKDYGTAYVLDGLDMTMTYVFNFPLQFNTREIIKTYDLLPRPAAVELKITYAGKTYFGFGEKDNNFTNSNFDPTETTV